MMYVVEHLINNTQQSFETFEQAQKNYYYQWRNDDGSIPFKITYGDYDICPKTGNIIIQ